MFERSMTLREDKHFLNNCPLSPVSDGYEILTPKYWLWNNNILYVFDRIPIHKKLVWPI